MSLAFGSLEAAHLPSRSGFDFPYALAVLSRQSNGDVYAWTAGSSPADVDRVYPWMSVTKFLVAVAFWRQSLPAIVGPRALSLQLPVGPPVADGVKLVDLLSHCSGLPFDAPAVAVGGDGVAEAAGGVGEQGQEPMGVSFGIAHPEQRVIQPYTKRIYSNYGIEMAGMIAERATGKPWVDWVRETVVDPLGMTGTKLGDSPAYGGHGTVVDLAKLAAELLSPRGGVLGFSDADLDGFCAPQHPGLRGVLPGYGSQKDNLWAVGVELHGVKSPHYLPANFPSEVIGHFGQSGSLIWVDRGAGVAGVFLGDRPFGAQHKAIWPALNAEIRELALLAQH